MFDDALGKLYQLRLLIPDNPGPLKGILLPISMRNSRVVVIEIEIVELQLELLGIAAPSRGTICPIKLLVKAPTRSVCNAIRCQISVTVIPATRPRPLPACGLRYAHISRPAATSARRRQAASRLLRCASPASR